MKSLQGLCFIPKPPPFLQLPTAHFPISLPLPLSPPKPQSFPKISPGRLPNPLKFAALLPSLCLAPPSLAAVAPPVSDKINIESVVTSIDDFFNRYPFFVAGCTVIWLVVVPLAQEYVKKCKFVPPIAAFRKLRDLPNAQLLDVRKKQSLNYLSSPSLKALNKSVVQLEFVEGKEEEFVKEALKRFGDPGNTVVCVLDNFDGNSLVVAELLFKNGLKEAYAIKGGLRGKDGWQAIQETLLPPSMHVYPNKKKSKKSVKFEEDRKTLGEKIDGNGQASSSGKQENSEIMENGALETSVEAKLANERPLSPYPRYPDLKPPSSPTPSKPQV